jgi:hypothetical protein
LTIPYQAKSVPRNKKPREIFLFLIKTICYEANGALLTQCDQLEGNHKGKILPLCQLRAGQPSQTCLFYRIGTSMPDTLHGD